MKRLLTGSVFLVLMAVQAWAAPVLTFNTGVNNAGVVLTNGAAVADSHYTLSVGTNFNPSPPTPTGSNVPAGSPIFAAGGGTVNGAWANNTALNLAASRWIAPIGPARPGFPAFNGFTGAGFRNFGNNEVFTYRTTFDLTGFIPSTAVLTGFFAADNSAVAFLNGNNIGTSSGFAAASAFGTANPTFFTSGVNVLTFVVTNLGSASATNPTGLRVQYGVTANSVPEINPGSASLPIAMVTIVFLVVIDRRRARAQA